MSYLKDNYAIPASSTDFTAGKLHHDSNIRLNRLFTADSFIVLYRAN
jgi:mRNA interferase MazF